MKGAHDLGGRWGLGAVDPEAENEEPIFHAEWERRAFAMTLALGMLGKWNIDEARYARERQHPVTYLNNTYYENWLAGIERLVEEKGLLETETLGELRVPSPEEAKKILFSGGPTLMEDNAPPRFSTGDKVRVKKIQTTGHTRAPGYIQGVVGTISDHYGTHVFADAHARSERSGEHLYSVSFLGTELWGDQAEANEVLVDLWEPYLEEVTT